MKNKVAVLLSTYNGEKYLSELLTSVEKQENIDFDICIRDDGSTDRTIDIIKFFSSRYNNIKVIFGKNIGYAKSFWKLLNTYTDYEYYAFCDQDDIWQNKKLFVATHMMQEKIKYNKPVLYLSRVVGIDAQGNKLSDDCFKTPPHQTKYEAFQRSIAPGCVFVFNAQAANILRKYKGYMESHDWATYAIIKVFGTVIYDSNSYILYRLHANNTIGKKNSIEELKQKIYRFFKKSPNSRSKFATDFYITYKKELPDNQFKRELFNFAFYRKRI